MGLAGVGGNLLTECRPAAVIKPKAKAASVSSEVSDEGVTIQVEAKTAPTSAQSSPAAKRK